MTSAATARPSRTANYARYYGQVGTGGDRRPGESGDLGDASAIPGRTSNGDRSFQANEIPTNANFANFDKLDR